MKRAKVSVVIIMVLLGIFVGSSIAGALTYEEAVPSELQVFFKSFDSDGDGDLSLGEAEAFYYWVEQNIKYRYDGENDPDGLKQLAAGEITSAELGDGREGADYSQTPYETWKERYGDCEDMAILETGFYDSFGIEAYVGSVNAEGYEIDHAICIVWVAETHEEFSNLVEYLGDVDSYDFEGDVFIIVDNAYSDQFGFITSELKEKQFTLMDFHTLEEELGIEEEPTVTPITEPEPTIEPEYEPEPTEPETEYEETEYEETEYEEIQETPGFKAVLAIAGIFAVAYILRRKK